MSKARFDSPEALLRRFAERRGTGDGPDFKSWLITLDVTKYGARRQMYSPLMGCALHVLSLVEAALILVLEWARFITSVKVQVPLPLQDTINIALASPYRHPTASNGFPVVMTTDAVATFDDGKSNWKVGFCVKYEHDIRNTRVLEKLEIERRTWKSVIRQQWFVVREKDLPWVLVQNLKWVRGRMRPGALDYIGTDRIAEAEAWMRPQAEAGAKPISHVANACDRHFRLPDGASLSIVRYLIGTRKWDVDLMSRQIYPSTDSLRFISKQK